MKNTVKEWYKDIYQSVKKHKHNGDVDDAMKMEMSLVFTAYKSKVHL